MLQHTTRYDFPRGAATTESPRRTQLVGALQALKHSLAVCSRRLFTSSWLGVSRYLDLMSNGTADFFPVTIFRFLVESQRLTCSRVDS
jgi:hypothetical protein